MAVRGVGTGTHLVTSGPPILSGSSVTLEQGRGAECLIRTYSAPSPNPRPPGLWAAPASGPGPFLLAGAGLGRAGSQDLNSLSMPRRGAPSEMVSAGRRKDTEEFGRQERKGLGRDTHLHIEGQGHTHAPLLQALLKRHLLSEACSI